MWFLFFRSKRLAGVYVYITKNGEYPAEFTLTVGLYIVKPYCRITKITTGSICLQASFDAFEKLLNQRS